MESVFFVILAVVTVFSALMVILQKNPMTSVLFLILAFFSTAALYVLLSAPFLAAVQIIVYAGAIMVLFLFVIMLLNLNRIKEEGSPLLKALGMMVAGMLLVIAAVVIRSTVIPSDSGFVAGTEPGFGSVEAIGRSLFTTYLLPFEIASFLLLAAIIGAVVLAKKKL
ncbi:MAG: NADH-quinone oxidoreductase subunit J [bacterium]|nr:NADH-quinone oxidoreductase subunit J [bacterium]